MKTVRIMRLDGKIMTLDVPEEMLSQRYICWNGWTVPGETEWHNARKIQDEAGGGLMVPWDYQEVEPR